MNEGVSFEKMCEKLFEKRGHMIKKRISRSKDYGIDIIMRYEDNDEIIAVQCKNTKTPVGRPVLQRLHSAMKKHNYADITFDKGFVVSASGFTNDAHAWVSEMNNACGEKKFVLIDFDDL